MELVSGQGAHMAAVDEAAERRRIAALDTMQLVELWEAPMPAEMRALILAELARRGYRTKSLPQPPPDDASADPLPTPEEVDEHRMHGSSLLLLVIGGVQILSAVYSLWAHRDGGLVPTVVGSCVPLVTGVAFLALYRVARAR